MITIGLIIIAIVFAYLGFSKAGDSRVAPELVSLFLLISGACFIAQFVHGIRRHEAWQRAVAVISILVAIFVIAMAFVFFQTLRDVKMPTF